jgi:hypothetical protein
MKSENQDANLIFGEALRLSVPAERDSSLILPLLLLLALPAAAHAEGYTYTTTSGTISTAEGLWAYARAWLFRAMRKELGPIA